MTVLSCYCCLFVCLFVTLSHDRHHCTANIRGSPLSLQHYWASLCVGFLKWQDIWDTPQKLVSAESHSLKAAMFSCLRKTERRERRKLNFEIGKGELQWAVLQHGLISLIINSKNNQTINWPGISMKSRFCQLCCQVHLLFNRCVASPVKCINTEHTESLSSRWWQRQHFSKGGWVKR